MQPARCVFDQSSKRSIVFSTMKPFISTFLTDIDLVNGSIIRGPNNDWWEEPHPDYFLLSNNSKIILSLNISTCHNGVCTDFTFTDKKIYLLIQKNIQDLIPTL